MRVRMRTTRALCASLLFVPVVSFLPLHYSGLGQSRVRGADGKESIERASYGVQRNKDIDSSHDADVSNMRSKARAAMPVVLVSCDDRMLDSFARSLAMEDTGDIVNLAEVTRTDGARGIETVLAESTARDVLMCPFKECLDHPEVRNLIHAHPLAVHLASSSEDAQTRRLCEQATKYTVVVDDGGEEEGYAKVDLSRLLAFSRRESPSAGDVELDMGKHSFFLCVTFDDVEPHVNLLAEITEGVDAVELRVDLLADHDPYAVLRQLSIVRRSTGYLPVVYTVRSRGQCGAFADDPDALFRLARWGLRSGCEVMDVESNWPITHRDNFIEETRRDYPGAVLVGSYHMVGRKSTEEQIRALFMECFHGGNVDAVKVVTTAFEPEDSLRVHNAARALSLPVPYIGLSLTETGKLSRVLNERFTPVTHEKLPFVAAPGQMSSKEIMRHRVELGLCSRRKFFLFGSPISASPSPNMHNAGFDWTGLPHEYFLCEGEDPSIMKDVMGNPDFGGASVTIPHKQSVLSYLDEVSEAAQEIGAVNTVLVVSDPQSGSRKLRGDNTDWLGILRPVKARLQASGWVEGRGGVALILGAGGAAMGALYAVQQLGLDVVVYNRTPAKAEQLAERFGGVAVSALDEASMKEVLATAPLNVVVSTVPAGAQFSLPAFLLEDKPVIFDAAYKPALTSLLAQAKEAHCPYVQGAEMLVEQGLEQFQLWTGRRAPRGAMEAAVFREVDRV